MKILPSKEEEMISTKNVHIITFNGYEYDRITTEWEIIKRKKEGVLKKYKTGLVFDFRHK